MDDQDRTDLLDALTEAYDDLAYRKREGYIDDEDIAAVDAKLDRWGDLIKKLGWK